MSLHARIERYRSPAVRDLVWAILSPTLIATGDPQHHTTPAWYQAAFDHIEPWLARWNTDDRELVQQLTAPGRARLGLYFERLWHVWLKYNGRFELLAHNIQITAAKQTLGELDCLVRDNESGDIEHWELAVKFYLGIPPLEQSAHWEGLNPQDRLDRKIYRLVHHQLPLSQSDYARQPCQQNGGQATRQRLISKGRLYYPFGAHCLFPSDIDPGHLRGYWLTASSFNAQAQQHPQAEYYRLDASEWLTSRQQPSPTALEKLSESTPPHALLIHGWQTSPMRLLVMPESYPMADTIARPRGICPYKMQRRIHCGPCPILPS